MLLGTIVEKDGMVCLQTSPRVWYPLEGNSGIASDFQETFGCPSQTDIGRQLHRVRGVLYMERLEQVITRLHSACNHDWQSEGTGSPDAREYRCATCGAIEERDRS